jgi:asparagine synthase (glutamine-hydrolysing)
MCGICGMFGWGTRQPAERDVLSHMLAVIRHRGPDDDGVYFDRSLAMGMRRLSIMDLAGGKQPISNEDGSVVVVFNGEIYNYVELREALCSRGHRFTTNCDTEVIVHLYEDLGKDCVQSLRGMFAFAVWDVAKQRLFLARDRLGIKPLYYLENRGTLVFGSEIKAILQYPDVEARLDREALSNYLSLKYVPSPQTIFAGIRAIPPAHTVICDSNGLQVQPYWRLSFNQGHGDQTSEEAYADQLEALLRESVRMHLMSDVPFGAFLSGGVDSSMIVALMSQTLEMPVKTFSVGFASAGATLSELPYARLAAERYQTDHHEIVVGPTDLVNLAEKVAWHLDQPIADNACLANYMVSKLAADQVKMVLTGEGADELFAGYARYAGQRLAPWFHLLPRTAQSLTWKMAEHLPGLRRPKLALFALCQQEEVAQMTSWFPLFNHEMKSRLLVDEYKRSLEDLRSESVFAEHLAQTDAVDSLNRMLYVDTKLWLPDDLLARGDKTSMAVSLEARVPFLDHKLVEFAASLPPQLKLKRLTRKYLLKKIARHWLPDRIIDRKKEGFPMPFALWFRKEARTFVRDLLSTNTIRRRGLFNAEYVQQLFDQHESGAADHSALIWGLVSVELWHRAFLDSAPSSRRSGGSLSTVAA